MDLLKKQCLKICPIELRYKYMKIEARTLGYSSFTILKFLDQNDCIAFAAYVGSGLERRVLWN